MTWLKDIVAKAEVKDGVLDADALVTAINAELPKHTMPKAEYNSVKTQLKTANDTIETLQNDNKDNETLQKTITDHETTIKTLKEDHAKELLGIKKDTAIKELLSTNNAKYPDLLKDKFNLEKILVNEDGTVTGLKEQLEAVKTSYADMFASGDPDNDKGDDPAYKYNPAGGRGGDPDGGSASFLSIIQENQSRK